MKKLRVTLKDLAKELNLAPSTISRALRNHPAISEATKKKVKEKAEELAFIPNSIASSFRTKKTRSIGVVVPRIDIHFHSLVISGIEDYAYKKGYNISIFQSKDSVKREKEITKILQNNMVEGIVACLAIETLKSDHFKNLNKMGIPLVFYDRVPSDFESNKIVINDYGAAFQATEHLIKIGCKNIGHIAGPQTTGIFRARLDGYNAALKKYGLLTNSGLIKYANTLSYEEGVFCAKDFLKSKIPLDGIFCANDYTAISAIQVFQKAGYNIPNDISILGFSNYPISRIIEPNLTTINDRAFEMGEAAAKLLIRQIEDEEILIGSETISIKTELIVRESTMRKN